MVVPPKQPFIALEVEDPPFMGFQVEKGYDQSPNNPKYIDAWTKIRSKKNVGRKIDHSLDLKETIVKETQGGRNNMRMMTYSATKLADVGTKHVERSSNNEIWNLRDRSS